MVVPDWHTQSAVRQLIMVAAAVVALELSKAQADLVEVELPM
jgi:hypothetical protein